MYELVHPVSPVVVLKYLALLMMGMGGVLLIPLIAAVIFGEYVVAGLFLLSAVLVIGCGLLFHRILPERELAWKEGLVLAAVTFPFVAALSTIPLAVLTGMPFLDVFFEAVSGITTTGLSVAPPDVSPLFLFTRSWLQWVGGIGIVVIVLVIFLHPGVSAYRLYTVNTSEEKLRPTVMATAWILIRIYLVLTGISFMLLFLGGMTPFDALCHALSSVSTGGFSTHPDSIAGYSGYVLPLMITISFLMGAVNFSLYARLFKEKSIFFKDIQIRYFILIAVIGILLFFFTLPQGTPVAEGLSKATFQALSSMTTSGFTVMDVSQLSDASKAVLTGLMWCGGCLGSTAGGIKIIRLIILLSVIHLVFIRFFLPSEALTPLKVGSEVIESRLIYNILTYVMLYFFVIIGSAFIFMLYGYGLDSALFEVSSALGTVGLSCGITGPALPPVLKLVLIGDMLLGRIEIIPLCILFFPRTWIER